LVHQQGTLAVLPRTTTHLHVRRSPRCPARTAAAGESGFEPADEHRREQTGLGIGAGTTGVFALQLAVRRQTYQEHTAADTTFDAVERRVTELYSKSVEQLGSAKAPVRLGGLCALERFGENQQQA
jgi:hypothetical protein